ncbi:MAG: membrane dipeptidase [Anaerolineae bacterium]|nr:membrane dipeptidase [Anaerolineae bacterium]
MFIVDSHLDLAYNAIVKGRDPRLGVAQIRANEPPPVKNIATVGLPEMRRAGIGLIFGSIFVSPASAPFERDPHEFTYETPEQAHKLGMDQIDYYRRLVDEEEDLRLVTNTAELDEVVRSHEEGRKPLLGIVILMEGADPIRRPEEAALWYERGVRFIGPAWDDTRYCAGAWRDSKQGLTDDGRALLEVMADLGMVLDLTHMSEVATFQSLDSYPGPIVATHANARAIVPTERQLSDRQIKLIGERDGMIGAVLCNSFLRPNYVRNAKESVPVSQLVAHMDHVCQVIGDARHSGIGSDLDGGFGMLDIPDPMDSIADMPMIATGLQEKGYGEADIAGIMGMNWVEFLRRVW